MKYITIDECKEAIEHSEKRGYVRYEGVRGHIEAVKKMWAEGNKPKFHPFYEIICDNS